MGRLAQQDGSRYSPEKIWDIHKEIARRIALGQKNVDIAKELNVSPQMVSYTKNNNIVQQEIDRLHRERDAHTVDVAKHIKEMAPKALAVLEDILDNEDAPMRIKLNAAQDILDRAGHAAPSKMHGAVTHLHVTSSDIEQIKQTALEEIRQKMSARTVEAQATIVVGAQ